MAIDAAYDFSLVGQGADVTSLDALGLGTVLTVADGVTATVDDVTLTGGLGTASLYTLSTSCGGGVFCGTGASLSLTNASVSGNAAEYGAGICAQACTVDLTDSTLADNAGTRGGGGAFYDAPVTLTGSTVSGNTGKEGGGLLVYGYYDAASLDLVDSLVSGNDATHAGGGLVVYNASTSCKGSTSEIAGFHANSGYAVYIYTGSCTSDSCDFGEPTTADDNTPSDLNGDLHPGRDYYGEDATFVCGDKSCD